MKRRSFFGTMLATLAVPFVPKAKPARPQLTINAMPDYIRDWRPLQLQPFAEFPAPIESTKTIKTTGHDDILLVVAGGKGYIVDITGKVTPLT